MPCLKASTNIALDVGKPLPSIPIRAIAGCCPRAASGHEAADPAITLMKSRRRIALPEAGTTPNGTRLQQGFVTGEMGFRDQAAQQQFRAADVRFGSKADIGGRLDNVRFTPESGRSVTR